LAEHDKYKADREVRHKRTWAICRTDELGRAKTMKVVPAGLPANVPSEFNEVCSGDIARFIRSLIPWLAAETPNERLAEKPPKASGPRAAAKFPHGTMRITIC
jgi:hypothetical protein